MTAAQRSVISALREEGYAIAIWTPAELGSADAGSVESRVVELGNEVIEDLGGPENGVGDETEVEDSHQ